MKNAKITRKITQGVYALTTLGGGVSSTQCRERALVSSL